MFFLFITAPIQGVFGLHGKVQILPRPSVESDQNACREHLAKCYTECDAKKGLFYF